ncbi:ACT domain-containing protein [Alkalimarinus coralli]|uniref:ACT domain-containing protein n=1 Tax=Alkalimarinus coralli TaxID=2935863 RepID=UPI00202B669A|nr:ACT domain-containing protein [Alkalimarinus coralli]
MNSSAQQPTNQKSITQKTISTIQCRVTNTPAILERLLRTVRVRGFMLKQLEMKTNSQGLDIELEVFGERNTSMLINQLNKLIEVQSAFEIDSSFEIDSAFEVDKATTTLKSTAAERMSA